MITISYARKDKSAAERIENILQQYSLAYQIEENQSRRELTVKDGKLEVIGEKAILEHLEELQTELHQWYYCAC